MTELKRPINVDRPEYKRQEREFAYNGRFYQFPKPLDYTCTWAVQRPIYLAKCNNFGVYKKPYLHNKRI